MTLGCWYYGFNGANYIIPIGQWIHFCLAIDGTSRKIYINGSLIFQANDYFGNIGYPVTDIGNFPGDPNTHSARGTFDDVRIYNRALSDSEILQLYNASIPVPAPATGMALIPAGSFTMGNCMDPNEGWSDELPLHSVYVSAFYMDKYDVTKALWDSVYQWATNHGYTFDFAGSGKAANHPVQRIDWYDCVKWCNARSEMEGRTPAYYTSAAQATIYRTGQVNVDNSSVNWNAGYRLPTEAEWEKAARGGASGQRFPWGNTISWSQANYYGSMGGFAYDLATAIGYDPAFNDGVDPYTSPVNYFAPNGYGLYDMAGNVCQWCWDWYGSYVSASQTDPRGPSSGSSRAVRGGSCYYSALVCRAADRYDYNGGSGPTVSNGYMGFRSALAPGQ
jgi:formylglycine-generating enzyme required for sulfatase activity